MKILSTKKAITLQHSSLTFTKKQECFTFLKEKITPDQKIMVAVSGGADSMLTACLLYDFYKQEKYPLDNISFIHCNHSTRSGNKDDEALIKSFFVGTNTIMVKRPSNKKASEAELRNWRYGEFKTYTKQQNIAYLMFGHNLTDRIESTFLNLLRGANLNGFLAMNSEETHHLLGDTKVLRPLLWLSKPEIFAICQQNNIPYTTDPTNNDASTSLRNKLRNNILPDLYALAHKQTATTNSWIESMKNIYEQIETTQWKNKIQLKSIPQFSWRKAKFAYQRMITPHEITQEILLQTMKSLNISNNITTSLLKEWTTFLQKNESGYKYFNKTYLFKSHGNIYILWAPSLFWQKTIDKSKTIHTLGPIKRYNFTLAITKKEYIGGALRFAKSSDNYHNKTRNQYCITAKIPVFWRNYIPVIVKEEKIIHIFKEII